MSDPQQSTVIVHGDAQFVFAKTTFCNFVGIDFEKVASRSLLDFIAPEDKENILRICRTSESTSLRFQLLRADGVEVRAMIETESSQGGRSVVGKIQYLASSVSQFPL